MSKELSHAEFSCQDPVSATRRGRRKNAEWEAACEQAALIIEYYLRLNPLRQPVDPGFDPYYQRMLRDGRLAPILEYCHLRRWMDLDPSFYEFLGQLVPLQSLDGVKKILSQFSRRISALRGYNDQYQRFLPLCNKAREFIEAKHEAAAQMRRAQLEKYFDREDALHRRGKNDGIRTPGDKELQSWAEATASIDREQLWRDYVHEFFYVRESEAGEWLEKLREKVLAYADALPEFFSLDILSRILNMSTFSSHRIVSKKMFFELEACHTTSSDRSERDRRYTIRKFLTRPNDVARKYACALIDISPSTASHS